MLYKYYLSLRPIGPGCQPKGFVKYESYPRRTYVTEINREAWAAIWYNRQLSDREIADYDLIEAR